VYLHIILDKFKIILYILKKTACQVTLFSGKLVSGKTQGFHPENGNPKPYCTPIIFSTETPTAERLPNS